MSTQTLHSRLRGQTTAATAVVASLLSILVAWQVAVTIGNRVPSVAVTVQRLGSEAAVGELWHNLAISMNRFVLGLAAALVVGAALGAWLIGGAAIDIWQRAGREAGRLTRLPRADWGRVIAHAGLGVIFVGISLLMAWSVEDIRVAREGESFTVAGYDFTLQDVQDEQGPNYVSTTAAMRIERNGREIGVLLPEKRVYPVQAMPTTEAAIRSSFWGDIYLVIGDPQQGGGWAVRTYIKPFAFWIWLGSGLMALGGLISLSDRRYRVAAGARKAPALAQPAE